MGKAFGILSMFILFSCFISCKTPKEQTSVPNNTGNKQQTTRANNPDERHPLGSTGKKAQGNSLFSDATPLQEVPLVVIYQTKSDYSKNVPVGLNNDRTTVISYPAPIDLKGHEPTALKYDFWLDNKGIVANTVFLKYTYEEWIGMEKFPSPEEMFESIIDDDPFISIYFCGKKDQFKDDLPMHLNTLLEECEGNPKDIFKRIK